MVDVPPKVYKLARLVVDIRQRTSASSLCVNTQSQYLPPIRRDQTTRTRSRSPPPSFSAARGNAKRLRPCQRKGCPTATSQGLALRWLLSSAPPPPHSLHFPQVHESVRNVSVLLETRVDPVNNHREEYVKQKGREHAHLTKALRTTPSTPCRRAAHMLPCHRGIDE